MREKIEDHIYDTEIDEVIVEHLRGAPLISLMRNNRGRFYRFTKPPQPRDPNTHRRRGTAAARIEPPSEEGASIEPVSYEEARDLARPDLTDLQFAQHFGAG